jgi:hypothetical protein
VQNNPSNVVGQLGAGESVNVTQCNAPQTWCYIDMSESGLVGWVSASYLANVQGGGGGGGGGGSPNVPGYFGFTLTPGGGPPTIQFGFGNPPPAPPGPPPVTSQACFYKGNNFTSTMQCFPSGTNIGNINFGGWNNTISSIDLQGGASVRVCVNVGYGAPCAIYNTDRLTLNATYNNAISSFQVY